MRNKQPNLSCFIDSILKIIKLIVSVIVKVISLVASTIIDELNLIPEIKRHKSDHKRYPKTSTLELNSEFNDKKKILQPNSLKINNVHQRNFNDIKSLPKGNNFRAHENEIICSDCATKEGTNAISQVERKKNDNVLQNFSRFLKTNIDMERRFEEYKKLQNKKKVTPDIKASESKSQKKFTHPKNKKIQTDDIYEEKLIQFAENINKRILRKK